MLYAIAVVSITKETLNHIKAPVTKIKAHPSALKPDQIKPTISSLDITEMALTLNIGQKIKN